MKTLAFLSILTIALTNQASARNQISLTASQKVVSTNELGAVAYNTQLSIGLEGGDHEIKTNRPIQLLVRINNLSTNEQYGVYVQNAFTFTEGLSFVVLSPSGKDISPVFHKTVRASGGSLAFCQNT